jgi:chemotaxis protein MotB
VPKHGKGRHHHEEHEEHVNHEAWVIPYADMLTLLMGLFLVLWALSNQDLAKMREFSQSFGQTVGMSAGAGSGGDGVLEGSSSATTTLPPPVPPPLLSPQQVQQATAALEREAASAAAVQGEVARMDSAEAIIAAAAASNGVGDALTFRREQRGLIVSIVSDDVLFDPGSASLRADGLVVLDAVAGGLAALPNLVAIEGHTDSVPIANAAFPSNWELSTDRASVVLRYLMARWGLPPARMVAGGYADQRPVGPNETPDGRARNRRVDIAVLATTGPQAVDPAPTLGG